VALTMTSASSSAPERSFRPVSVNVSMWSVTTDARPLRSTRKRSPLGTRHIRWSHGSYLGVKWVSRSKPSGSWRSANLRIRALTTLGRRRLSW
jgi:hypothetical protein